MKKKICFIVAVPQTANAFLKDHISCLSQYFDIHLVANIDDSNLLSGLAISEAKSIKIDRKINLSSDLSSVFILRKYFKEQKFFAVHSVTPKAALLTAIASFLARTPNRIHIYTGQVWATSRGLKRWLLMACDKLISILNTHLLVDGYSQREFLIQHHILSNRNSFVMGNGSICGVQTNRFTPNTIKRDDVRQQLSITKETVVFIFLGRLNRDKGITELLEAFNKLSSEYTNVYLLLVGYDEEQYDNTISNYPHIKKGSNYCYYGPTRTPEDLLQTADVFCLPSYREGFGSSVIEASCIGIPVICSSAYGLMDAMVDNITGLRCNVKDTESLYIQMKRLYMDANLRKELGSNGRKRVLEKFSGEVLTKAWLDFYNHL